MHTLTTAVFLAGKPAHHGLLRYFMSLGPLGLFLVSVIDSSPIPLPIPGSSDLLVTLFAAAHKGWLVAALIATAGSAIGAIASYQTGVLGGVALIEKYVPRRLRGRMTHWTEHHALLSVALPAVLPPPAPLMPFLIAAGALRMPRRTFYSSFLVSRFLRHAFFAWLGVRFGSHILPLYTRLTEQYGWILLIVVWGSVVFAAVYALIKLRQSRAQRRSGREPAAAPSAV